MVTAYTSGKYVPGICDRCGQKYRLHELKVEYVLGVKQGYLVCPTCWDEDHPQLRAGRRPVTDPQRVRDPRPDRVEVPTPIQWGWAPVGGAFGSITPNTLVVKAALGEVTV